MGAEERSEDTARASLSPVNKLLNSPKNWGVIHIVLVKRTGMRGISNMYHVSIWVGFRVEKRDRLLSQFVTLDILPRWGIVPAYTFVC